MRVLVCGGRSYRDQERVFDALNRLEADRGAFTIIMHGGAKGADNHADVWARTVAGNVCGIDIYYAEWSKDGKAAGPLRNQRMLDEGRPDLVIAFPGGNGTADMVARAKRAGVSVVEVAE